MPNSHASPAAVDFITALGRLLQSGPLRDAFATDPLAVADEMGVYANDRAAFLQLVPADLEFQGDILLRKRFDLVRQVLPRTCRALGEQAWPKFRTYGREHWPTGKQRVAEDARGFCDHLHQLRQDAVCPLERHRACFVNDARRFSIRYVRTSRVTGVTRGALQIFFRQRAARWHEWVLYVGV